MTKETKIFLILIFHVLSVVAINIVVIVLEWSLFIAFASSMVIGILAALEVSRTDNE